MKSTLLLFLFICRISYGRDILYFSSTQIASSAASVKDAGFSLPPVGPPALMWTNGFGNQFWTTDSRNYSIFKWNPALIYKINDNSTLVAARPTAWAAESKSDVFSADANSSSLMVSVSNKSVENPNFSWSYGLLSFDRTNRNRLFPILGASYLSEDKTWRFNMGYPNVAIIYLGSAPDEISLFFGRESGKILLQNIDPAFPESKYLDANLNLLGLSYKSAFAQVFIFTVKAGVVFNSKFEYLNSNFEHIGTYKDYSGENFVSLSISIDPGNPLKF